MAPQAGAKQALPSRGFVEKQPTACLTTVGHWARSQQVRGLSPLVGSVSRRRLGSGRTHFRIRAHLTRWSLSLFVSRESERYKAAVPRRWHSLAEAGLSQFLVSPDARHAHGEIVAETCLYQDDRQRWTRSSNCQKLWIRSGVPCPGRRHVVVFPSVMGTPFGLASDLETNPRESPTTPSPSASRWLRPIAPPERSTRPTETTLGALFGAGAARCSRGKLDGAVAG